MIELWEKFFNGGWNYRETPSKQDCFKAGFEAGIAWANSPVDSDE